jgi:protein TonB
MVLPELFRDVVDPSVKVGDRSFRSLPVSVLLHGVGVAVVLLVALTASDVLPTPPAMMAFVAPAAPAPAPPPPPPPPQAAAARQQAAPAGNPAAAPVAAPSEIRPETGLEPASAPGEPGGVEGGLPGGVAGEGIAILPEAPPPAPPAPRVPIRVGGSIRPPARIKDVPPVYPMLAIQARVQGVVVIEAEIDADGKVKGARVLRSIPLLDRAALDAVERWEYMPTLLGGVPHPVLMVVTVNFFLTAPVADVR